MRLVLFSVHMLQLRFLNENAALSIFYLFLFLVDMPTNQEIYGHTSKQAYVWNEQVGL